jgi:putative ABC transport system permease protein
MSPLGLAWRSLTRQPARAVLGVIGIAAVAALLWDMLLLSRGLVLSFRDVFEGIGYELRVTATEALPGYGPELQEVRDLLARVEALPGVAAVGAQRFGWATVAADGERPPLNVSFMGAAGDTRGSWSVFDGETLPPGYPVPAVDPPPIVVSRFLAETSELSPGSTFEISHGMLPAATFRVVGIADFSFDVPNGLSAVTTLTAQRAAYGVSTQDSADMLFVGLDPGADPDEVEARLEALLPDLKVFSVDDLLERFQRTDFAYFRQISFVLTTITLFFAFLLVTTLLTVSVNQRFGEIAGLRAIGFSRARVAADLFCESALLVGSGALLALPLGQLIATWLDAILKTIPEIPEAVHFFVYEPRVLVLYTILIGSAGVLAAVYPMVLASRLPIARTLRNEVVS